MVESKFHPAPEQSEEEEKPNIGCFFRLIWQLFGNLALPFCAIEITQHNDGLFSTVDTLYWGIVAAILAARFVDILFFKGTTGSNEPATLRHLAIHAGVLLPVALGVWLLAHFLGRAGWW